MVNIDFLEEIEVFNGLDDDQLIAIQGCCRETEFLRGEKIFDVEEEPLSLWAVTEGEVELRQERSGGTPKGEDRIATISRAMIFG